MRSGLMSIALAALGCGSDPEPQRPPAGDAGACPRLPASDWGAPVPERRDACLDHDGLRRPYFGDLHVHTRLSWDAYTADVRTTPSDAYAFARGEAVLLPPLDASGRGTRSVRLARALDFAAVTDHSEFLGEVITCTEPGAPGYDSPTCATFRAGGFQGTGLFGTQLASESPQRFEAVCGADGAGCVNKTVDGWRRIRDAAEAAYDRTSSCRFTSFVGYEWTGATGVSNLHRNVVFRDEHVPETPVTYFDDPHPEGLWRRLACECRAGTSGCEAVVIPHNSNLSNGKLFQPTWDAPADPAAERERAELRAASEPLVEIFQHKGASECRNGLAGTSAEVDPLCDVEQLRNANGDCGDAVGTFGMVGQGCTSRWDFVRNVLIGGLGEAERLGINPYQLGIIASTDTHVGTPGATDEQNFQGHLGSESEPSERLGQNDITAGIVGNPGGLAGVWATENSRHALFDALQRREVFGTSGTRIVPRFFGGWRFDAGTCGASDLVARGYAEGVAMGGNLPAREGGAPPSFVISAQRDPDPGAGDLERLQIVKGWIAADGTWQSEVIDVATAAGTATVDEATCAVTGGGAATLCGAWSDPDFDPARRAVYYARVVETPSCRWSWRTCLALPAAERPAACSDAAVPRVTRELAWTSPIWYSP